MNAMNRIQAAEAPTTASDGDLLRRFQSEHDDQAFAELLHRHGPMVFGVCLRRLGQTQDTEDAFQAVFLALATHAAELVDRPTIAPWLHTLARRVSANALRSRRRRRWLFWASTPEPAPKSPTEVDVDLDAALATLSEPERSAIVLCHLEGLSRSEAAKALGVPEGTLSARLSRGLEKLRRKLGKAPLGILAASTLVVLPEPLSASTLGLVRHLRDGTLEDWAPPHVLELYRKATPMRLLDRFGPPAIATLAALFILLGAAFGWHLVTAQPSNEPKQPQAAAKPPTVQPPKQKKSFAAAVEEMQKKKPEDAKPIPLVVQLKIGTPITGLKQQPRDFQWGISVTELVPGGEIFHTPQSWPAIEPLLKQIVEDGKKQIEVKLDPHAVGRLEANQVVNICRRAGFVRMKYSGPKLLLGDKGDDWKASTRDLPLTTFDIELSKETGDLPDWTNGWFAVKGNIHYDGPAAETALPTELLDAVGGLRGPAADLAAKISHGPAVENIPAMSDWGKRLNQRREEMARKAASVNLSGTDKAYLFVRLPLARSEVVTYTTVKEAGDVIVRRIARLSPDEIEVTVGDELSLKTSMWVHPLQVNWILNLSRRAGIRKVRYVGQELFTGATPTAMYPQSQPNRPVVEFGLDLQGLDGDLPDETNGWALVNAPRESASGSRPTWWVVKSADQEQFLDSLSPATDWLDAKVKRLIKLPLDEFEREIAKEKSLLQRQLRKRVEEAKAKATTN